MRTWLRIGILQLAIACGSKHPAPPAVLEGNGGTGGVSGRGGGSRDGAGGPSAGDDGILVGGAESQPSAAGMAGATFTAGAAGEAGAGDVTRAGTGSAYPCASNAPPVTGTSCDPEARFAAPTKVSVDAGSGARLIGVTPDELTIVWSSDSASGVRFLVADRVVNSDDFGPATPIVTDDAVVGLSPDGLRVVTLSPDGASYQELTRAVRGYDFGAPSAAAFTTINAAAMGFGIVYRDCVISADDHTLIYTALTGASEEYPIRISTRSGSEPWPRGTALRGCELQRHGALIRHPTGLSSDGLTLFFFDPDRMHARAAWRRNQDADFDFFVELEVMGRTSVNATCHSLYYSTPTADAGLFVDSSATL